LSPSAPPQPAVPQKQGSLSQDHLHRRWRGRKPVQLPTPRMCINWRQSKQSGLGSWTIQVTRSCWASREHTKYASLRKAQSL